MSKPRSTRIRKGVEVINHGRRASVTRTTTLNMHGPMADLLYTDNGETGVAMIADLVRADEFAGLIPDPTYTTVQVGPNGKPVTGAAERRYLAPDAVTAAELAASAILTREEQRRASVSYNEDGVWTFTPSTGSPVRIRVTDPIADDAAAAEITPPKFPEGTPEFDAYRAELGTELEKFARHESPYDGDVVARTEQLHPSTHPYRTNEVVEYVGPSGIGSWVHGPMHFRRMVEVDVAEVMTMSGPQRIEVTDLRRPASNIAVELTPDDVARLFQALAQEAERLAALGVPDPHTAELRDRFAALHP